MTVLWGFGCVAQDMPSKVSQELAFKALLLISRSKKPFLTLGDEILAGKEKAPTRGPEGLPRGTNLSPESSVNSTLTYHPIGVTTSQRIWQGPQVSAIIIQASLKEPFIARMFIEDDGLVLFDEGDKSFTMIVPKEACFLSTIISSA